MRELSAAAIQTLPIASPEGNTDMTTNACTCPSCSTATLVGSEAIGLCTSCGSLSLAGTAVPLVAVVLVALAARALFVASRTRASHRSTPATACPRLQAASA